MKDILIIPTFSRPELLWLCLDHIAACHEAHDLAIRVCLDAHRNREGATAVEVLSVLAKFPQLTCVLTQRPRHDYIGNSYNVMTAYREAYESDAKFVFMVEDDILVAPDFFAWHYAVQKASRCFCSIGAINQRRAAPADDGSDYWLSAQDYASWAVCFRRTELSPVIVHALPEYFSNMERYLQKHLSGHGFDGEYCEQDGLIIRIMGALKEVSAWPFRARAQHIGWYGYHRLRSHRPQGTLESRYMEVKAILNDPARLAAAVKDFHDIKPLEPSIYGRMTHERTLDVMKLRAAMDESWKIPG